MFSHKYAVVLAPPAFPPVVQTCVTLVTVSAVPRCFKYSQSQLFFFLFLSKIVVNYREVYNFFFF